MRLLRAPAVALTVLMAGAGAEASPALWSAAAAGREAVAPPGLSLPGVTVRGSPVRLRRTLPAALRPGWDRIGRLDFGARLALGERFAASAATRGWADRDFRAGLPSGGLVALAVGGKLVLPGEVAPGRRLALGMRYRAPEGMIGPEGLDLTGEGAGYLEVFALGRTRISRDLSLAERAGLAWGPDERDPSYLHAHARLVAAPVGGVAPEILANALLPLSDGRQPPAVVMPGEGAVDLDPGADTMRLGLALGARYAPLAGVSFAASLEGEIRSGAGAPPRLGVALRTRLSFSF